MFRKIYEKFLEYKKNVVLAAISVLVLGMAIYFFNARINISKILDNYIQNAIAQFERDGYRVSFDEISFNAMSPVIKVKLKNFRVSVLRENASWQYATPEIKASIFILNPNVIKIRPDNRQLFIVDKKKHKINSENMELKLRFHNNHMIREMIFMSENLAIDDICNLKEINMAVRKTAEYNVDPLSRFYDLLIDVKDVDLAKSTNHPLSSNIKNIFVNAEILGDIGLERARISMDEWRDIGGSVDIKELLIDWEPMKLKANGAMAIDDYFQPMIVLSTEIDGIFKTLKSFENKDIIKRKDYSVAKIVLKQKVKNEKFIGSINIQENRFYLDNILITHIPMLGFVYQEIMPDNMGLDKDGNMVRDVYAVDKETGKAIAY